MGFLDVVKKRIWQNGDATCLARIHMNGSNITQADISAISRKIYDLDSSTPGTALSTTAVAKTSVVFDSLQTDDRWTEDSTGYNFRNAIAGSNFPSARHRYRIAYAFTGSGGEKFFVAFEPDTEPDPTA